MVDAIITLSAAAFDILQTNTITSVVESTRTVTATITATPALSIRTAVLTLPSKTVTRIVTVQAASSGCVTKVRSYLLQVNSGVPQPNPVLIFLRRLPPFSFFAGHCWSVGVSRCERVQ